MIIHEHVWCCAVGYSSWFPSWTFREQLGLCGKRSSDPSDGMAAIVSSANSEQCSLPILFHLEKVRYDEADTISVRVTTGRPCVLTLGDSGTVPAITSDCSRVAELLMRRRYFDLCCV